MSVLLVVFAEKSIAIYLRHYLIFHIICQTFFKIAYPHPQLTMEIKYRTSHQEALEVEEGPPHGTWMFLLGSCLAEHTRNWCCC